MISKQFALMLLTSFTLHACATATTNLDAKQIKIDGATVQQTEQGLLITLKSELLFEFDSDEVQPKPVITISEIADLVKSQPNHNILVEGYTDNTGDDDYNVDLSQRRADSVRAILIQQGVDPVRIKAYGFGEMQPLASNDTSEGRQLNRRVEVTILNEGKPFY
jgi:outer membrane protein OmpA-like peptidoglycan-associated protein